MLNNFKQLLQRIGSSEIITLVALALIVGGVWGFLELASEVSESETMSFDQHILTSLRQPDDQARPIGPSWLLYVAQDITSMGSYTILTLVGGLVVVFFALKRKIGFMVLTLAAIVGGALGSTGLKLLFSRDRPTIEHLVHVSTYSFPSGHAMLSTVVYLTLGTLLARSEEKKRFKIFFLGTAMLLALLVGLSRVYLGVHYPTDVLAGWIAGAVWALFCLLIAALLQRRSRSSDPPRFPT